jgi:Putative peptidoglycan binding domain/CHAP domain
MTTIKKVLIIAESQLGISENPPGTNRVKYGEWYGVNRVPWCAIFVSWVLDKAGLTELHGLQDKRGSAYCPYIEKYYRDQNRWSNSPKVGAIVLFDWQDDGVSDHIGFVVEVKDSSKIITIEGNTSATDNSNGGQVQRRTRNKSDIRGYGMPIYQPDDGQFSLNNLSYEDLGEPQLYLTSPIISRMIVEHVQKRLLQLGYSVGDDGPDSYYGVKTEAAVKSFQKDKGLEVDGWVGRNTWKALFTSSL